MKILLTFIASIFATVTSFGQTFSYNGLNYNVTGTTVEVGLNPSASGAVVIPDTVTNLGTSYAVTSIGNTAFYYCTALTSITLPNSVTSIGYAAFTACPLNIIDIPNSVTSIGNDAFFYCNALTSISIPNSVTSIGSQAFQNCYALTSITLPNSLTIIENSVFRDCGLTSITIPNSVTTIGDGAFKECAFLTSITIPNSVTTIGNGAFQLCTSLTSITIPNSVTTIGDGAFKECTFLTSITIPNSVTTIGDGAFQLCTSLTSIILPNSLTSIGDSVFKECSSLTSITLPNSVTSIGNNSFSYCFALTSITLPNTLTSIGEYVFQECASLTSLTIPNSVTNIGNGAFYACTSLTSITLPNSLTSIGDYAFTPCPLNTIDIPNSVTNIGIGAFHNCSSLISITIPNSVTTIGDDAFQFCTSLTSITIPNSVTSIGNTAFYACSSLTSITLPNSLTSIGDYAFQECNALSLVVIDNSIPLSINSIVFAYLNVSNVGLCIPVGSLSAYQAAPIWQNFNPITESNIVVPTFDPLPSYCSGSTIPPLPTTSTNGVIGTWNPAINPYATTLYTFTPTNGCAGATMLIEINSTLTPLFNPVPSYCSGATIPALPTTSNNGIIGTWSPAINPYATITYTFTPTNGCAPSTSLTIQINELTGTDIVSACNSFTWIDGNTYTSSNNTATFTLTNAAGCDSVVTLNLTIQPATASLTNTGLATTSTCQGTLEATMIGGTAPFSYTFNLNPSQDSSTLINACAGFNFVTITDAVGCSAVADYFLPYDSTSQPLTAYVLVTAASLTGVCDGEAEVFVMSGTAPYTFSHSSGASTSIDSALCEGVYSVTVTDALGATVNLPYMVAADTNTLFIYQDDTSNAYNTTPIGAIENCNIDYSAIDSVTVAFVVSFAVDSVTVIWNVYSGGGALEVIPVNYYIGFGVGYYNFILDVYCPTKSNGKFLKVTAKVNVSSLVTIDEEVNFITGVYPNPFTGNLTVSLAKENQYTLSLYDISGRVLFSKKYDNTNLIELSELDYLSKGEYLLRVQSAEGMIVRKVVK